MISGKQALGSIDETLHKAHAALADVESQIGQAGERLVTLQQAQLDDLRALATLRLQRLDDVPAAPERLERVEEQARALLARREDALAGLQRQIAEFEREHRRVEEERKAQAQRLDDAVAVVDEAESRIQVHLDADPDYRARRETAEAAQRQARHAREKANRSTEELEEKGAAYRADPLFMYLWGRHYGLSTYRAGGLFRWLDGKVARLVGYADARANFSRLNEIPRRLREHADTLGAAADRAYEALRSLDDAARAADGIPALEASVADEQAALEAIDARLHEMEAAYQAMLERRAAFAAGDDEHTREAVAFLAAELARTDIADLRRVALVTPYPEDDVIVSRLRDHEDTLASLRATLTELGGMREKHQQRLRDLEELRVQFKRHRYDRAGSVFSDDAMLPALLGQFLAGMLDSRMLWKVLQQHQRYRPRHTNPDFGSGGFGRGTVWRGGLGDLGDVFGRSGGFRTGGGFGGGLGGGGGGFRTGGGF